jgi:hypothetical protein
MYYADELQNAQLAIDCFEVVLKKSHEKGEMLEASNGKSQGWLWKLSIEEKPNPSKKSEGNPFRTWTRSIASTYPSDVTAIFYYGLSAGLTKDFSVSKEDLAWYPLAWSLLQSKQSPVPPGFHYYFSTSLCSYASSSGGGFGELSNYLSALEHLTLFASTTTLKDLYIIQRSVIKYFIMFLVLTMLIGRTLRWELLGQTHPRCLNAAEWNTWKKQVIDGILTFRREIFSCITNICVVHHPIDPNTLSIKSAEGLRAQLDTQIARPKRFLRLESRVIQKNRD